MTFSVADLRGAQRTRAPPSQPIFFHFHAVFRKNWANSMLAPPPGVGAPPLGNPRSATVSCHIFVVSGYKLNTSFVVILSLPISSVSSSDLGDTVLSSAISSSLSLAYVFTWILDEIAERSLKLISEFATSEFLEKNHIPNYLLIFCEFRTY